MAADDTTNGDTPPPHKRAMVKAATAILAASLLGSLAVLPYSLALVKQLNMAIPTGIHADVFWIILLGVQVAVELVFSVIAVALGLWLGNRVELGVPWFEAWLAGDSQTGNRWRRSWPLALALGFVVGAILILLEKTSETFLPRELQNLTPPGLLESLLASIGAGIREEVWFRFGVMTLLVWIGTKLAGGPKPTSAVVWISNVLAALAFGALHLPQAAGLIGLTGPLAVLVLLLNGVGGMAFGWLYWRHGLFAAMLAHFSADVVLKVIGPLLP